MAPVSWSMSHMTNLDPIIITKFPCYSLGYFSFKSDVMRLIMTRKLAPDAWFLPLGSDTGLSLAGKGQFMSLFVLHHANLSEPKISCLGH